MKLYLITLLKFSITFVLLIILEVALIKTIISKFSDFSIPKKTTTLILGDSETETALNDSIVKNSVNLCQGADPIFFSYIKLKKVYNENNHLKTVVLGFDPDELCSDLFYDVPVMRIRYYNYFYLMDIEDYGDLLQNNTEGLTRGVAGLWLYYFKAKSIIQSNDIHKVVIGDYLPRESSPKALKNSIENDITRLENNPDPMMVKYFYKIVDFCSKNDLKLIVLSTPIHKSMIKSRAERKIMYNNFLNKIKDEIIIWDYEDFLIEDKYYYDNTHLNSYGAELLSIQINDRLNNNSNLIH